MSHFKNALTQIFNSKDIDCTEDVAAGRAVIDIKYIEAKVFKSDLFAGLQELFGTTRILWSVSGVILDEDEDETTEATLHLTVSDITTYPLPAPVPPRLQRVEDFS